MEADKDQSGVYEYDPLSDKWEKKTNMITQGWNLNLAEADGIIYAIGGDPFRNRLESYNPVTNEWKVLNPMPTPRQHSNCCAVDGKIYVMGGITSWTVKTDKNEMYDIASDTWRTMSTLPVEWENPILAAVGKNIFTLCGDSLWMYDTRNDTWEAKNICPGWVSVMFGCAVIKDKVIIAGGQNRSNEALSSVYIYNTTTHKWHQSTDMPEARQLGGIATLNNKIYIIGGSDSDFNKYTEVFEGTLIE